MEFRCTCTEAFLVIEEKKIYVILNHQSPQLLRDNMLKSEKMHSKNKTEWLNQKRKRNNKAEFVFSPNKERWKNTDQSPLGSYFTVKNWG